MKKILVTGATGFIGHYVVQELLHQHYAVIASSSNEEKAKRLPWFSAVNYIPLDFDHLGTGKNYFDYFQQPDLMIHLAWEGLPNYTSPIHLEKYLPRQSTLLINMLKNGLADLTVAGTCFEYGKQEGCLNEEMLSAPANPYAIAKNELRKILEDVKTDHHYLLKWVRLFYMYGKGQNPNSLLSQLDKALENNEPSFNMSGGEQSRDYLPVEKVAEYIVKIALQKEVTGIINCCSGQPVTIKQFVKEYLEKKNKSIKLNFGHYPYTEYEPMHFWGDTTKLKTIIDNE